MVTLTCDVPGSIMAELSSRVGSAGDVSVLVREALAQYLSTPLHTLFQVSTSGSLVEGVYSEAVTCAQILEHGDFGVGTFTGLDGEMVVLDGRVYRVQGTGRVTQASLDDGAPFAIVTRFEPSIDTQAAPVTSFAELAQQCDRHRRSDNLFYAIRLDGTFDHIRTRAVSPPKGGGRLLDAAKAQKEFDFRAASGTLVGIYSPAFSNAFSVAGYHFHFLSDDRTEGGHLLDISAGPLRLRVEELSEFHLALPETETFLRADLSRDASEDLRRAETS